MPLDEKERVKLSKTMSYILRHRPERFDILLDPEGFAPLEEVLEAVRSQRPGVTKQDMADVVAMDEKGRFEIMEDDIRACYGHSIDGRIEYDPVTPPEVLFHGTPRRALSVIREEGLRPMNRQYVHLTVRRDFAVTVGKRRDKEPAVLTVQAARAHEAGFRFYKANENFFLADEVPPQFIKF
jgi:putative RNA 2'-phosphotransferase